MTEKEVKPLILTRKQIKDNAGYTFGDNVWGMILDLLIDQRDADTKWFKDNHYVQIEPGRQLVFHLPENSPDPTYLQIAVTPSKKEHRVYLLP